MYTGAMREEQLEELITCTEDSETKECNAEKVSRVVPIRGDLHVNIKPSWEQRDVTSVASLLQDSELSLTDPLFERFLAVLNENTS